MAATADVHPVTGAGGRRAWVLLSQNTAEIDSSRLPAGLRFQPEPFKITQTGAVRWGLSCRVKHAETFADGGAEKKTHPKLGSCI